MLCAERARLCDWPKPRKPSCSTSPQQLVDDGKQPVMKVTNSNPSSAITGILVSVNYLASLDPGKEDGVIFFDSLMGNGPAQRAVQAGSAVSIPLPQVLGKNLKLTSAEIKAV